jgi:hypothetical protein
LCARLVTSNIQSINANCCSDSSVISPDSRG